MPSFYILYSLLATSHQLILSISKILFDHTLTKITFNLIKKTTTPLHYILFIPHFICIIKRTTPILLSLTFLIIQYCYLFSQYSNIKNIKIVSLISYFINMKYTEPLILFISSLLVDLVLLITYINNQGKRAVGQRMLYMIFNLIFSISLSYFLDFKKNLIIMFVIFKMICFVPYFCIEEKEKIFKACVWCTMNFMLMSLFYLVHSLIFIGKLKIKI